MRAHTERTEAQTFPTAPSRALHAQPRERRTHAASPGKGRRTRRYRQRRRYTHSPPETGAQPDTPAFTSSPGTHTAVFGAVPLHRLRMLRLKLCSSWKWRGCTGERRRRAGKGFLGIFCSGIYFFFFLFGRQGFPLN